MFCLVNVGEQQWHLTSVVNFDMNMSIHKLENICLHQVVAKHWFIETINNHTLSEEVLTQQNRLSSDPRLALFEDTAFNPSMGVEGNKFINELNNIFLNEGLRIQTVWSQIHRPLESTSLHNHEGGNAVAAFVYYASVPIGSGVLCFEFEGGIATINPEVGHLYMFPTWAKHKVTKNMGSGIRVSISGNLIHV